MSLFCTPSLHKSPLLFDNLLPSKAWLIVLFPSLFLYLWMWYVWVTPIQHGRWEQEKLFPHGKLRFICIFIRFDIFFRKLCRLWRGIKRENGVDEYPRQTKYYKRTSGSSSSSSSSSSNRKGFFFRIRYSRAVLL